MSLEPYPEALTHWRRERGRTLRRVLAPRPKLTVSEWADAHRILSRENCAEPGPWSTNRVPYLREIMDCFSNPAVEQVVFMKSARIGGTEAGNNVLAYFIDRDPSPILAILPTVDLAKGYSKEQLAPLIRDNACIHGKVKDVGSRDSGNTIQQKTFPGGVLTILGANSGTGFRMRTVRVFYGSEVDAWPASAGSEGDPVALGVKRTETFANRKIYLESTPLLKDLSRIEAAYTEGDQRQYHVPCPDCGHEQLLRWKNLRYEGLPEPLYACEGCGVLIPEEKKYDMVARGRWIAGAPFLGTASFRINALYSPFDGARWPRLVKQWKQINNDNTRLQAFVNTVLGESWEIKGGSVSPTGLMTRRETYPKSADGVELLPAGVTVLVAGVDVQDDRIEVTVKGVGPALESWLVAYKVLAGDPGQPEVWQALEAERVREYVHASGALMRIRALCIDTGHHQKEVAEYVRPRQGQRVIAVKGSSQESAPLLPRRPSVNNKGRVRLYVIGTNAAKATIYSRLRVRWPEDTQPGEAVPLYCHFPDWADEVYFDQLTAEKVVQAQTNGRWGFRFICPPGRRNEALDCEVYALIAWELCGITREQLPKMALRLQTSAKPEEPPADPDETGGESEAPPAPKKPNPWSKGGGGYMSNFLRGGGR